MSKRTNGEGTISKRKDGKWLVKFPTGIYKPDGKREYVYKYCATQAEAAKKLRELQLEKTMGVAQTATKETVGDWLDFWMKTYKVNELASSTFSSYNMNIRIHIKPYIGNIALKDLTTSQIQIMLDKMKGICSRETIAKNKIIINGALEKAKGLRKIGFNPCTGVSLPKAKEKDKPRVLSTDEQRRLVKALDGEYYRDLVLFYLNTGLRMGEAIPLTWRDINLDKKIISINKKAIVVGDYDNHSAKQEVENYCKTKSSKRVVAITAGYAETLKEYMGRMKERTAKLGNNWSEDDLVFQNTNGKMVYNRNFGKILDRIYKKAGIENATVHTLRHTYATRCFEAGVDIRAVSEQLGHASTTITNNVYIHLLDEMRAKEIDKLDKLDDFLAG